MQETIIQLIEQFGYIGVSLLIFIENIFPPIPSEVILLFGGYASHTTNLNIWIVILSATIGSILGAIVLYFAGYALGKERLKKLLSGKLGKWLHFGPENIEKADHWFGKFGYKAVLICRCIPVVRSIVSIPAGICKINFGVFLLLTFIGSIVWNTIITWLGFFANDAWTTVQTYLGIYSDIILVLLVLAVLVGFIILSVKSKNKKNIGTSNEDDIENKSTSTSNQDDTKNKSTSPSSENNTEQ